MKIFDQLKNEGLLNPSTVEGAFLYAIVFAAAAWLCGIVLRVTVERVLARDKHDHFDRMAVKFIAKLLRYGVYIFAFIAYTRLVPSLSGLSTASLTSISVITVVVGLAAQNTLGNLVAGIALLLYRPFKLGDRLQVMAPTGVEIGTVESLGLGYTLLRTDENRCVVVPNSLMASQTSINLTGNDPRVLCSVPFTISYDSDIDQARRILLSLAGEHPKSGTVSGCPLTNLGGTGMTLSLDVWCADAQTAITLRCDLLERAIKRFAAEGVRLPTPHAIVILQNERPSVPLSAVGASAVKSSP